MAEKFKPVDFDKQGLLSSFEPTRPTEKLRRWLLDYFATEDGQDQVGLQNKTDMAEKMTNLSMLPWLGNLGHDAVTVLNNPGPTVDRIKDKGWRENIVDAAFFLPAARGLHVPKFRTPKGGIAATHVSPQPGIKKFEEKYIATDKGEGTVDEEWGHYSSNEEKAQRYYQKQFDDRVILGKTGGAGIQALNFLEINKGNFNKAISYIDKNINLYTKQIEDAAKDGHLPGTDAMVTSLSRTVNHYKNVKSELERFKTEGVPDIPRSTTYDLNLDVDPEILPSLDKPMSDDFLKPKAKKNLLEVIRDWPGMGPIDDLIDDETTFRDVRHAMNTSYISKNEPAMPKFSSEASPESIQNARNLNLRDARIDASKAASIAFREAGIPGHEYMPAEGHYKDTGSRNFVMYNPEKDVEILQSYEWDPINKIKKNLTKYGLLGLFLGGGAEGLMEGQEQ
ncbi:MAG: hypothetical protein EHM33_00325 [Chloroflexi bacterium]|nr:MAG: hypothetical protein EHM33_00325 [Chloroflexota bacterium]